METRTSLPFDSSASDGNHLRGYAMVFNSPSNELYDRAGNPFIEVFRPNSINIRSNTLALWNHDPGEFLASSETGHLKLYQDSKGLGFDINLPDTSRARDVKALLQRGEKLGMSIGFGEDTIKDRWTTRNNMPYREVLSADLYEMSVVALPAFPTTSVNLRSKIQARYINNRKLYLSLLELE